MVNPKLCSTCERIYNATGVVPDSIGCPEFRSKALTSLVNSVAKSKASSHKSIYTPVNIITEVYYDDVLCGRGKFANNRPGNRHYRRLLEDHCEAYSKCKTYRSKGHFTRSILQEVKRKGRFLKPLGEGRYVEISDDQGRVKVGQVRRSHTRVGLFLQVLEYQVLRAFHFLPLTLLIGSSVSVPPQG
uniref:DUF6824 domain-containing protein n=1 Tax=Amphora coffeiformis TaxID=265554 RepID=A0A7S3L843_9STRA|mmetsp:Transcript_5922/g.11613  ORF Transcript_5922/g.11613 Transcript_5922/m.11613 type:complete len:187 (+) Transcript_5922:182-742(+)